MPLNPDAVGSESEPVEVSWTSKDALLYAVGIGAGARGAGVHDREHQRRRAAGVPDVPGGHRLGQGLADGRDRDVQPGAAGPRPAGRDAAPPDPGRGHGDARRTLDRMYDKQKAAVVVTETTARWTVSRCTPTARRCSSAARADGAASAVRPGPQNVPPERAPDHEVTYETSPDQAFVYRLSGDRNPLHTDPSFAAMGGFDRPILHGLCSYGFTGRALLHSLCGSDPARFHHIEGRFAAPVLPGRGADDEGVGDRATARPCSRRRSATASSSTRASSSTPEPVILEPRRR